MLYVKKESKYLQTQKKSGPTAERPFGIYRDY